MFTLSDTILLRCVKTSGLVDNLIINVECMKRGLNKLKSVINILSDNLHDEVGDHNDNLKVIVAKVDPTHTHIIIKKT